MMGGQQNILKRITSNEFEHAINVYEVLTFHYEDLHTHTHHTHIHIPRYLHVPFGGDEVISGQCYYCEFL